MIETSKVSFLVFYFMVENTEKDASRDFFFLTQKVFFTTHTIERSIFSFFRTFVYLEMKRYLKIRTQHENALLVVRVALKKMRILLYYYYSYYY